VNRWENWKTWERRGENLDYERRRKCSQARQGLLTRVTHTYQQCMT
jgi:hypothetical protein